MGKQRWTITSDKFLTEDQVNALVVHLTNERDLAIARGNHPQAIKDYYIIRAILESGLRVFEFCNLITSDFQGQKLTVRHGKGNKPRTVLLTKATSLLIKEWLSVRTKLGFDQSENAPLFPSRYLKHYSTRGVQKRVKEVFQAVGLPTSLSVHSLRHTYCSLLLASGRVGIGTVRDNLGHHSISVTNLYSHAIGNLDDVELYPAPSSDNCELSEPNARVSNQKPKSSVKAFLSNVNLKAGDPIAAINRRKCAPEGK